MATQKIELWNGLVYETPEIPPLKKIRANKEKTWHRHTEYTKWNWNDNPKNGQCWWDDPEPGQIEWYYDEITRILKGEWVLIDNQPVFLNLFAYFYFQWFVTKEGQYPKFKDICVHFMYFMEIVFNDPKCRGGNTMKGRRKHVSTMCISIMLQFGIIKTDIEEGLTSKEAIDAEKIFKLMLVNAYAKLPNFLKPRIAGTDLPVKTMHIVKKAGSITKDKSTGGEKEGLNNKIEWRAPNPNVFDGDGLWFLLLDEGGKWTDIPIDVYLEIALNSIVTGSFIGRVVIITTVNKGDKGGQSYKVTWVMADQSKRDELGQTKNKLYQHFIPGYMGGREGGWIDKYGNSVWDTPTPEQTEWMKNDGFTLDPYIGCKAYCELQRKLKANDPEKLQEEIRMFPFNPDEVFRDADNMCHFNIGDLNDQKDRLSARLEYSSLYRTGHFKKGSDGNVYFKDADAKEPGKFYWYVLELLDEKEANKFTWEDGNKAPLNTTYGAGGADLIMNTEKTSEKGSDSAMVIFKRYNALDAQNSGLIVAFGIGRPSSVTEQHEQLFFAAQYYGIKFLIERSPSVWYDYAKDNFLLGYCIKTRMKIGGHEVYGVNSQDSEAREQHLTEMIEYAEINMDKIWYMRILEDMMHFNVKDRTLYDGCMAFGYSLMALKEKYLNIIPEQDEATVIRIYNLREKYANR